MGTEDGARGVGEVGGIHQRGDVRGDRVCWEVVTVGYHTACIRRVGL